MHASSSATAPGRRSATFILSRSPDASVAELLTRDERNQNAMNVERSQTTS